MINKIFEYNAEQYPFIQLIGDLFNCKLDEIHKICKNDYECFDISKDSDTEFHKKFYDKMRSDWFDFTNVYKKFISEFIHPIVGEDIIFQKWPTFRVQLPDNLSVGRWHTDSEFNHPEGEINFILAITPMFDSNTIILESSPNARDFRQIEIFPGQVFMFNGNKCMHGNILNKTGKTRISLDFRVLRQKDYKESQVKKSITMSYEFKLGKYYDKL